MSRHAIKPQLRFVLLSVALTSTLAFSLWPEDPALLQRAEALWAKAEAVSKIDDKGIRPYHEEATFTLYHIHAGQLQGTYKKDFVDSDNWVEEIRLGAYRKYSVHKADKLYKLDNAEFTPRGIQQLMGALPPLDIKAEKDEKILKFQSRKLNGIRAVCVESEIPFSLAPTKHETCMSETDGALLSEWKWDYTTIYSSQFPFQGKLPPAHFEVRLRDKKVVDGEVLYRERPDLTSALIEVPQGARLEPQCKEKVPVQTDHRPEPEVPAGHHVRGLDVAVVLEAHIGADGSLKNALISQSEGKDFDQAALDAVRQWHFTPSLCDGVPIDQNISIETNFRSSN